MIDTWDQRSKQPTTAGWYAVALCWDEREGVFPNARYWTGTVWDSPRAITAFAGPFSDKAEAKAWARAHDPEGL